MKSRTNSESAAKTATSGQASSPSVPLSVYRELAAELQATRAMVDSLNAKNQELTLHNQKLRQEIHRFVQSAMNLRSLVEPVQTPVGAPRISDRPAKPTNQAQVDRRSSDPAPSSAPTLEETAAASVMAAKLRTPDSASFHTQLFTEEAESPRRIERERPTRDLGGLWLVLTILVIMVTAFGAGFWVVRPLLPTSNSK